MLSGVIVCFCLHFCFYLVQNSSVKFGSENQESVQRDVLLKAFKHFLE